MKKKLNILFLCLTMISVFIFLYVFNRNTALITDDYAYQFVFENRVPTSSTRYLSSVLDLFVSMANHWRLWGGRVVVHFLLQFSFLIGIRFFDIVNSLMFVLLGYLVYKHINDSKKINVPLLIIVYAILFLFIPQPGATIFWKSGSANYLWSAVIMLLMTLYLKKKYDNKPKKHNIFSIILLFICGLIVGNLNENSGCALIVMMLFYIAFYNMKYDKIPKWCFSLMLGLIFGYLFLIASPGNYIRADEMYPGVRYGFFDLIEYILKITRYTYDYMSIIFITLIITSTMVLNKKEKFKEYIIKYGNQILYIIFILISIYSLVLSPATPERCWTFPFVYAVITIGINIKQILENKKYSKYLHNVTIISMLVL